MRSHRPGIQREMKNRSTSPGYYVSTTTHRPDGRWGGQKQLKKRQKKCFTHTLHSISFYTVFFCKSPKPFFCICDVRFWMPLDRFFTIRNNISPAKCLSYKLLTVAFLRLMALMDVEDYVRSLMLLGGGKNFLYTSLK